VTKAVPKADPGSDLTYEQRIQGVYKACKEGQPARAEALLAGCPAEARGWEWRYCKRLCRFGFTTLAGHSGEVYCVTFSPDGKRLASGGADATVRVWDEQSPAKATLLGHSKPVVRVAFSPDGNRIISIGRDKATIEMIKWDAASGKRSPAVSMALDGLMAVDISTDGRCIAGGTRAGTIKVWNTESGREEFSGTSERSRSVQELALGLDGQEILYHTIDGWGLLHRGAAKIAGGRRTRETVARKADNITCMALSPDGSLLAAAAGNLVTTYDPSTRRETGTPLGSSAAVTGLAFSPDGKSLAVGDGQDTIEVWDTSTRRWTTALQGHAAGLSSIRFSPDGRRIAASSLDRNVYVWEVSDGLIEKAVNLPAFKQYDLLAARPKGKPVRGTTSGLSFSEDGALIILHRDFGVMNCATYMNAQLFCLFGPVFYGKPLYADFDRFCGWDSCQILVGAAADGSIHLQTDLNGLLVREAGGAAPSEVFNRALGRQLVPVFPKEIIGLNNSQIYINIDHNSMDVKQQIKCLGVWDLARGQWSWVHKYDDIWTRPDLFIKVTSSTFGDSRFIRKTRRLVAVSGRPDSAGSIAIFSAETGELLGEFPGDSYRIHPDGDLIATQRKGEISVFRMSDGGRIGTFPGADCSFSPSGKRLATWAKREAAVWDLETKQERCRFSPASAVAFSPDDRRVLAVRKDAIAVKDASTGKDLLELSGPTGRFTFSPDGSSIVSADFARAKIWVADPPEARPRPE
jgi:WD40 repeat protein